MVHAATGEAKELFPTGKNGEPLSARLPKRELLLGKDTYGFVRRGRRPASKAARPAHAAAARCVPSEGSSLGSMGGRRASSASTGATCPLSWT